MDEALRWAYRIGRVRIRQAWGIDPVVPRTISRKLEHHGNSYCGWAIPVGSLDQHSVIVDVGLGEDISFSQSLMKKYDCEVQGFDPTPKSIQFVNTLGIKKFSLHKFGLGDCAGVEKFYLPVNQNYVSGSIGKSEYSGDQYLNVEVITLDGLFDIIGFNCIDLLKMDIEGSEYDVIMGEAFARRSSRIKILAVEFHHRWRAYGKASTDRAVARLRKMGFECCWSNSQTNEEFAFVNTTVVTNQQK
jgi:FkbM family methyltransferase